jgi:hypothetical protein
MRFAKWKPWRKPAEPMMRQRKDEEALACPDLLAKLQELEAEIACLKEWKESGRAGSPIVVESLHIEHFKVDKVEYTNNFEALGIKELAGQLYIGANYRAGASTRGDSKKHEPSVPSPNANAGPRCTIKAKDSQ